MQAKKGDTVAVHYVGTLDDGRVFDSSRERDPLEFTLGAQMVVPGFENAVLGMSEGDTVTEKIPCDQAYGPRRSELTLEAPRDQIPPEVEVSVGQRLQVQGPEGQTTIVTVAEVKQETVVLDANHPLAGLDLTFEIELVAIKSA